MKIALAGNPNSGKSTLFNDLTGSNQYVGNRPGVTVEKKDGYLKQHTDVIVQDLPGIYSLSPYTLEEVVTRTYLVREQPDAILNIVDATNIERNLYLTTQLAELEIPITIALNMMDLVRKNGDCIQPATLSELLHCPVVGISALKKEGCLQAAEMALRHAQTVQQEAMVWFEASVEAVLTMIEGILRQKGVTQARRWYAIKVFERDVRVLEELQLEPTVWADIEQQIAACEAQLEDDAESIIANQRYCWIEKIVQQAVQKKRSRYGISVSDKIDRVVTHRWLALPIFAAVMGLIYYLAVGTIGTSLSDWVNEVLFGEYLSEHLTDWMAAVGCQEWLIRLVVEGMVSGVGAVLGFVPQMLMLFLMLSLLEDVGYMARVAFIMDWIFRKFGLSGKSFIPLLIGSGCGVPGVMASRTIENERDRRMTIMTTCFIPCGAKIPIIALFSGAFFGGSGLVAVSAYFIGMVAVVLSGLILKKTRLFAGNPAPFVMELPNYHVPNLYNVCKTAWERGWSFIKRAGTVILAASMLLWFLQSFGFSESGFGMVADKNHSILAMLGNMVAFLFVPLGFGQWQAAVATFTGLLAKENVVSTFGVLYGFAEVAEDGSEIWSLLTADFSSLAAFSFMIFNLLCAPCAAAVGAIRDEMGSARWMWIAVGWMCAVAYVVALMIYQFGCLMQGSFSIWTLMAFLCLAGSVYLLLRKPRTLPEAPQSLASHLQQEKRDML